MNMSPKTSFSTLPHRIDLSPKMVRETLPMMGYVLILLGFILMMFAAQSLLAGDSVGNTNDEAEQATVIEPAANAENEFDAYSKFKLGEEDVKFDGENDFATVEQKIRAEEAESDGKPSEDDLVDLELKQLEDAERKVAERKALEDAAAAKAEQDGWRQEDQDFEEGRKEVLEDIEEEGGLPIITDEDINWNGLYD